MIPCPPQAQGRAVTTPAPVPTSYVLRCRVRPGAALDQQQDAQSILPISCNLCRVLEQCQCSPVLLLAGSSWVLLREVAPGLLADHGVGLSKEVQDSGNKPWEQNIRHVGSKEEPLANCQAALETGLEK